MVNVRVSVRWRSTVLPISDGDTIKQIWTAHFVYMTRFVAPWCPSYCTRPKMTVPGREQEHSVSLDQYSILFPNPSCTAFKRPLKSYLFSVSFDIYHISRFAQVT